MTSAAAPGRDLHELVGRPALPPGLRRPIGIMAVIAALVSAVLAARYSGHIAAGWLDRSAQTAVGRLLPQPGLAALLINIVGEPFVAAVLAGLLAAACLALGRRRLAVVAVAGPGLTGVVTTVLKPVIGRTIHGSNLSYPSGHTAAATVLALVVTLLAVDLLQAGRLPGMLLILAGAGAAGATMAWSQVAEGAHYPTDTIGGFCTAMAVVPATAMLVDWFATRRRGVPDPTGRRRRRTACRRAPRNTCRRYSDIRTGGTSCHSVLAPSARP